MISNVSDRGGDGHTCQLIAIESTISNASNRGGDGHTRQLIDPESIKSYANNRGGDDHTRQLIVRKSPLVTEEGMVTLVSLLP